MLHSLHPFLKGSVARAMAGLLAFGALPAVAAAAVSVTASGDDGHRAANTLDGSLSPESRWSAEGDGQWIQYNLGRIARVKSMDLAFYQGDRRVAYFDVLLSSDGKNWTQVLKAQSSGRTNGFQSFDFADRDARYVRVVGHGNSANLWNSIVETRIRSEAITPPDNPSPPPPSGPKPVYQETFEGLASGSFWKGNDRLKVQNSCGVNNSKCLRVSYVPTSNGSERLTVGQTIPAAREYTLNYDVMFENSFEWVKGGKLPGLAPSAYTTGCKSPSATGWSVRMMWRSGGEPVLYVYDQNRSNRCGEDIASGVKFSRNTWHALSVHVKVNAPASASNGEIGLYLGGKRIAHTTTARLRGAEGDRTLINQFIFHTFFGGNDSSWSPGQTVFARFDNIAVYPGLRIRNAAGQ